MSTSDMLQWPAKNTRKQNIKKNISTTTHQGTVINLGKEKIKVQLKWTQQRCKLYHETINESKTKQLERE